ncbi:hypothetical protein, partial [Pseudomonas aeruginosa]
PPMQLPDHPDNSAQARASARRVMPARLQDGAARHRLVHAGAATMALPWALAFRNKARTR